MITLQRTRLFVFSAVLWLAPCALHGQNQANAAGNGARQFARNCAGCHGEDGRGGDKAPAIATMPSVIALSDAELSKIVRHGTQNGMPAFPRLSEAELASVVQYLRTLQGKTAPSEVKAVTGNASSGAELFFGKARCSTCHRINSVGSFIASDLTTYGRSHSQDTIIRAMRVPQGVVATSLPIVEVRTKSGEKVAGAVRSEDNFNLELQSRDGRYYFLKRDALVEIVKTSDSPIFHDYKGKLTEIEMEDIARYLVASAQNEAAKASTSERKGPVE